MVGVSGRSQFGSRRGIRMWDQNGFRRETEYGPKQQKDLVTLNDYDVIANNFLELADKLGC